MSETEQQQILDPEGAVAPPEAPETPAGEQPTEREKETESRYNKRIGYQRALLTQTQRERDELAARLTAVENQLRASGHAQPDPQAAINAEIQRRVEEERHKATFARFDAAGAAAYPDWNQRCNELAAWGAVPIAQAMAEMPDGPRIAIALHNAPEELEEILSHQGRARDVALGKFAAKVTATPNRNVSRAPAPPKPIQGRAAPQFNEQAASTSELVDYYSRQDMERRRRG